MKKPSEKRSPRAVLVGLLFFGCLSPKAPSAASGGRSPLLGAWEIVEQTATPLMIIPLCKSIRKGTTVRFTPTTFAIYVDAAGTPCNSYAYTTSSDHITFMKADMFYLCTYELRANTLQLTSNHFFIPEESGEHGVGNRPGNTKLPVVITFKRK